jgi:hypothetical protein
MAWTTPRTWITGEVVTAAQLNQQLRDNSTFLRIWPRYYSAAPTNPGAISTTETVVATVTVVAQNEPYRIIPALFIQGTFSVASDGFNFKIREDSVTGTVLAATTEVFPSPTGARHIAMANAIPIEVAGGGAKTAVGTVQRNSGTGTFTVSTSTGNGRIGCIVIPSEV